MPTYNRGGKSLKVGDIGRFNCLRQHLLYPGERMRPQVRGNVRVSGLKQQTSVYLDAQIEAFAAPLRWYQSDWPEYVQEGVSTAKTVATLSGAPWTTDYGKTQTMGIGRITNDFAKFFAQHPINIWNEWYRWHEDAKESVSSPSITFFQDQGKPCVNLASAPTRVHTNAPSFDTIEKDVSSVSSFDVRDLEQIQARFAQAAKEDWTGGDRYQAFMRMNFGTEGSREVDQVPIRLNSGARLSVQPRDMYATDGASLGELMSINNFQVNHTWGDFVAPEHMVVAYVMVLRFAPVFSAGVNPMAYPGDMHYNTWQGEPHAMSGDRPVQIKARQIEDGGSGNLGYLPAHWECREGYNHVDHTIKNLGNFPLLDTSLSTAAAHRDASNIEPAFRSTALRHWFADLDFDISVRSRIPSANTSIGVGSDRDLNLKGNHPIAGWLK